MQETGPEPVLGRDELGAMFRLFDVTNKGSVTVEQANAVRDAVAPFLCATQAATLSSSIPVASGPDSGLS